MGVWTGVQNKFRNLSVLIHLDIFYTKAPYKLIVQGLVHFSVLRIVYMRSVFLHSGESLCLCGRTTEMWTLQEASSGNERNNSRSRKNISAHACAKRKQNLQQTV